MSSIHFHNFDVVISKIKAFGGGAPKFLASILDDAMNDDVYPLFVKQISMSDHTLEDLRKLGHPYSTKFGVDSFVHPDDVVHIQDGNLLASSRIVTGETINGPFVRLENDAPEYIDLRYGTPNMRMRDPGGAALAEAIPLIEKRFKEGVQHAVIQFFKS